MSRSGPLRGEVEAAGSKNACLPLLAAGLLVEGTARFTRVPRLRDVSTLVELLTALGGAVTRDADAGALEVATPEDGPTDAPYEIVRRMRASVCVLGPLLARRGLARVPLPGGCVFGPRPVDLHVRGMEALGAEVRLEHGVLHAQAPPGGLRGGRVDLAGPRGPTVLGTANVLMAAVLARGETEIRGAAREPEVVALARWLRACGARVEGEGGDVLRVQGVAGLRAAPCAMPPDRIETGTLLLAGALTRGRVRVRGAAPDELGALLDRLEADGCRVVRDDDGVAVDARDAAPRGGEVVTAPHPGFPTDLQAQWTAYATRSEGETWVRDPIYPERFQHAAELVRLGADLELGAGAVRVRGPVRLTGAPVLASDLRASAALVLAGLVAEGTTVVRRIYHLDRGYEALEHKLGRLGARVVRTVDDQAP